MIDICDLELIGSKLEQDGLAIDITESYFKQQVIAQQEAGDLLKKCSIANLVGNKIVGQAHIWRSIFDDIQVPTKVTLMVKEEGEGEEEPEEKQQQWKEEREGEKDGESKAVANADRSYRRYERESRLLRKRSEDYQVVE